MNRGQRWMYRSLVTVGALSLVAFYGWWLQPAHLPENFRGVNHVFDVVIFVILTLVLSHRVFMDGYTWIVVRKIQPRRAAPPPPPGLKVAFITTFVPGAEGLDLLARTLPAILAVEYPHDTWLLDEGDDPDARALCESLGVRYFTRKGRREYNLVAGPFTAKTKGGNHNAWYYDYGFGYDIVAQIDTDFPPRPDFLMRTLGYFADPEIGWVGTPQIYGNTRSFVAQGAAEQQFTFYGPVMRGLAGRRMANMLGANHVVRVAALAEINYYAGHLTEDLLTGMRLHAKGWRSEYVPEPLAIGEGPDTWQAYFNQQMRWAYGCLDILRYHTGSLVRSMSRSRAMLYVSLQQGYFSGLAGLLGIGLLVAYFAGGVEISQVPTLGLVLWGAPLFLVRNVISWWLQRFNVRPHTERGLYWAGRVLSIAVWPIFLLAFIGIVRQKHLAFKVTPKGGASRRSAVPMKLFRPHLLLAAISGACLALGVFMPHPSPVLMGWAALNTLLLGAFTVMAVIVSLRTIVRSVPRRRARAAVLSADVPSEVGVLWTSLVELAHGRGEFAGEEMTDSRDDHTPAEPVGIPRQRTRSDQSYTRT